MCSIYWHTTGKGEYNLILLHGWGLNAEIWQSVIPKLSPYFRLHLVDLPGFGRSNGFGALTLSEIGKNLLPYLPSNTILVGWSFGGLVATHLALNYPKAVQALITVASSPCFIAQDDWPGIRLDLLQSFKKKLSSDFLRTVEQFLEIQTIGTEISFQDIQHLKNVVLSQPLPSVVVIENGFSILCKVDLRSALPQLEIPFLRMYGSLDNIVPSGITNQLDKYIPSSSSIVIQKGTHMLFISHLDEFCQNVLKFIKSIM